MSNEHASGRHIGILLILQMAAGLVFSFVLMDAVRKGYPSFLETAAASSASIRAGVVLGTLGAILTVAIGVSMCRFIAERSRPLAIFFVCLCTMSAALDLVHNAAILSMLSASEQLRDAAGTDAALYNAWGMAAASMRRSAHIAQLIGIAAWISTFYISLFKAKLIAPPIAVLGMLGILSQFIGVTVMMFLGNSPVTYLAAVLAPIHLLTAGWIIVKGLPHRQEGQ
jgi:hypothetical protein